VTAQGGSLGNDQTPAKLALLSVRMVHWNENSQEYEKKTYSVMSTDSKEDTFHAWAHLRGVLLEVFLYFSILTYFRSLRIFLLRK